jgi:lipopolysaccharide transport system ATP-binding protein
MPLAIRLEDVSKRYRLGEIGTGTISQDLERAVARFFGRPDRFAKITETADRRRKGRSELWALKDVSTELPQGEVLGIIGRNGAGKSTLLKLLSRITAPTTGTIRAKGRIASLLEVGTGFHPELTGRENVHLNGAILGMTNAEVTRRFDEIVEFSGCSQYIDTPVKRYSSGMLVRLGFSVAAHLDCEVMVVDEVLAVGDAEFQRRCLGRMQEISGQQGRTVLFVSHNMVSIERLCTLGLLLDQGQVAEQGDVNRVIAAYERLVEQRSKQHIAEREDRSGNRRARVTDIALHCDGDPSIRSGSPLSIEVEIQMEVSGSLDLHLGIRDIQGSNVGHLAVTTATGSELRVEKIGKQTVLFDIPRLPLTEGTYTLTIFASVDGDVADWIQEAITFNVASGDFFGTGKLPPTGQARVLIEHQVRTTS